MLDVLDVQKLLDIHPASHVNIDALYTWYTVV